MTVLNITTKPYQEFFRRQKIHILEFYTCYHKNRLFHPETTKPSRCDAICHHLLRLWSSAYQNKFCKVLRKTSWRPELILYKKKIVSHTPHNVYTRHCSDRGYLFTELGFGIRISIKISNKISMQLHFRSPQVARTYNHRKPTSFTPRYYIIVGERWMSIQRISEL